MSCRGESSRKCQISAGCCYYIRNKLSIPKVNSSWVAPNVRVGKSLAVVIHWGYVTLRGTAIDTLTLYFCVACPSIGHD